MMEGASNGGMLYHEVQESKLCAVHCVNTVLQGPFFSEFDLAALASDLDYKERQMMMLPAHSSASGDLFSHNVSLDGDFSIQVHFSINFNLIYFIILIHNQFFSINFIMFVLF
jgi:ataxin-3